MGRAPCCDKNKVKRGPWSPEEDTTLKNYVLKHGTGGNWIALPHKAGLKRCGKSCRLRWLNYLRPNIKHGGFTEEEDNLIISIYSNIGSRWSVIASHLPGRTDNDIKNYWNTKLKKRLVASTSSIYSQNLSDFPTTSNNISLTTSSSSSPALPPPPPPLFYGNSSTQLDVMTSDATTLTYPNIHGIMPDILPYQDHFPLPRLMEVQENGPSTNYHYNVPCNYFSPNDSYTSIYDPMSYASYYTSWSADYNGVAEEVGFLMELGSNPSYNLLAMDEFDNLSRHESTGI